MTPRRWANGTQRTEGTNWLRLQEYAIQRSMRTAGSQILRHVATTNPATRRHLTDRILSCIAVKTSRTGKLQLPEASVGNMP